MVDPKNPGANALAAFLTQLERASFPPPAAKPALNALFPSSDQTKPPALAPPNSSVGLEVALNALLIPPGTPLRSINAMTAGPKAPIPPSLAIFANLGATNALKRSGSVVPPPGTIPSSLLAKPKARATFYSFHYKDVFRVNHIRKAGVFQSNDRERCKTPQDRSLWERAKQQNPATLARMIDNGLEGTTVTVVLAGYETWNREWVRYEIARSLARGNGLVTVYIDGCECPKDGFSPRGPNPLSFMAVGWNNRIYEKNAWGEWVLYSKITDEISYPKWLQRPIPNHVMPLDRCADARDWVQNDGRQNLIHWTHAAALAAGK